MEKNAILFLSLIFSLISCSSSGQTLKDLSFYKEVPFYKSEKQIAWVDSIYNSMSLDQKLGQLFMVAAYSNKGNEHEEEIKNLIKKEGIGGLIFMQDNAERQIDLTNEYQTISNVPLLIGMDAEWGVGMRLKGVSNLPWAMTLGAVKDNQLAYRYGKEIANQLKRVGAHINFGPVVDVNTNSANPIIGNRSFGSDVENVSNKGIHYSRGLEENNILSCAKHFPGHGDTNSDSHKTLPSVLHNEKRLNEIELAPFKALVDAGVSSIMVAHLSVPALEKNKALPSTLSPDIITGILKENLWFKGLIITDALNMKGVTNSFPNGETDVMAFKAGNDILLFSQAVNIAKQKIKTAITHGEIDMLRVDESVKKILMAKYAVGLNEQKTLKKEGVLTDLNSLTIDLLKKEIAEKSITVLENKGGYLPIKNLYHKKIAYVKFGRANGNTFAEQLKKFATVSIVRISSIADIKKLSPYDYVIIGVHNSDESPYKSYFIDGLTKTLITKIAIEKPTVLSIFTSAYSLKGLQTKELKALILGYQNSQESQLKMPEIIFGASSVNGRLPVSVDDRYKAGMGISYPSTQILGYASPEEVGMSQTVLSKIDRIANEAISSKVTPGMQVLVARKSKIIYEKCFGTPTYDSSVKINENHIYDVASVTKVTGTLPIVMKAIGEKKIYLNQTLGEILTQAKGTNKENLILKDILGHQAGLKSWIGFYKETLDIKNGNLYLDYYSRKPDNSFSIPVSDNIFLTSNFNDSIKKKIYNSPVGQKKYSYSDLGFYLLKDVVEKVYAKRIDSLVTEKFFKPLNMSRTVYNAREKFPLDEIVPTEQDKTFRRKLVHGWVHDQGAALTNGVGGHAGLFSTSKDMAKIMQMYMNGGYYNGQQLLDSEVVQEFTSYQFLNNNSRRGLGFDKQQLGKNGPTCGCTTKKSFGHQGFTGTMVWSDPGEEIVYIFLSNRIHPSVDNNKINSQNIRSKIQAVIYESITKKIGVSDKNNIL